MLVPVDDGTYSAPEGEETLWRKLLPLEEGGEAGGDGEVVERESPLLVNERYRDEVAPDVRLPTRVGFDLNDCESTSLLDLLEAEHGLKRDVPTMFISEAVMFYVNPKAIASLYADIFDFGQKTEAM